MKGCVCEGGVGLGHAVAIPESQQGLGRLHSITISVLAQAVRTCNDDADHRGVHDGVEHEEQKPAPYRGPQLQAHKLT